MLSELQMAVSYSVIVRPLAQGEHGRNSKVQKFKRWRSGANGAAKG